MLVLAMAAASARAFIFFCSLRSWQHRKMMEPIIPVSTTARNTATMEPDRFMPSWRNIHRLLPLVSVVQKLAAAQTLVVLVTVLHDLVLVLSHTLTMVCVSVEHCSEVLVVSSALVTIAVEVDEVEPEVEVDVVELTVEAELVEVLVVLVVLSLVVVVVLDDELEVVVVASVESAVESLARGIRPAGKGVEVSFLPQRYEACGLCDQADGTEDDEVSVARSRAERPAMAVTTQITRLRGASSTAVR